MARVVVTPEAAQQLAALPRPIQQRVTRILERLTNWPNVSGCKALTGSLAGYYRIRTGDYRVQFRVENPSTDDSGKDAGECTVVVTKIGHRDGFYGD